MKRTKQILVAHLSVLVFTLMNQGISAANFDPVRMMRDLSSEELGGRKSGESGAVQAAEMIEKQCQMSGLAYFPGQSSFRQEFTFLTDVKNADGNDFSISSNEDEFFFGIDWITLAASSSSTFSGEGVLCGYGIQSKKHKWDDFAGVDLTGKAAIIIRGGPVGERATGDWVEHYDAGHRVDEAVQRGAKAIIFVNNPFFQDSAPDKETPFWALGQRSVPLISITAEAADRLFIGNGTTVKSYLSKIKRRKKSTSMIACDTSKTPLTIDINTSLETKKNIAWNIIATLPGNETSVVKSWVALGAHYDHLGHDKNGRRYPGADDNASGVAMLLSIAEDLLKRDSATPQQPLAFCFFGAEELGLLGSRHFVESGLLPLEQISCMLNLDMVGRLMNNKLLLLGSNSFPAMDSLFSIKASEFDLEAGSANSVPNGGDHGPFIESNIPAALLFTGTHKDYHQPGDTFDKLNLSGFAKLRPFFAELIFSILNPAFESGEPEMESSSLGSDTVRERVKVSIGIIPGYESTGSGLLVKDVRPGTPADLAGIEAGDLITSVGKYPVMNIYDYTFAIRHFKAGDKIELKLSHNGQLRNIEIELINRNK
jgi:hypothetical protein